MKKILGLFVLASLALVVLTNCGDNRSGNVSTATANGTSKNAGVGAAETNVQNSSSDVSANANNMTTGENNFINEAAVGGMAEVELGKLASSKTQNPDIKKFAQMMVVDHSKANAELMMLAKKKDMMPPSEIDAKHQAVIEEMATLSGAEFDKAYVSEMLADHENDVKMFQAQAQSSKDTDLKAFAAKTLPTLEKHLEMIRSLSNKLNAGTTSGGGAANANTNTNAKSK